MSSETNQLLISKNYGQKDSIWKIARKHIEWYILVGEIIIAIIGALILLFPETIPYREAIGGGLFMLGITMILEEIIKARDKEEHELEVKVERDLHINEVNEEKARQLQLQETLDKTNADLIQTRKDLSTALDDIHMIRAPVYQQLANALGAGFGFWLVEGDKEKWFFCAKKLGVAPLYIAGEPSQEKKNALERHIQLNNNLVTNFAFQLGCDICVLSSNGFTMNLPVSFPILETVMKTLNVRKEIRDGAHDFTVAWMGRSGKPEESKKYFLLLWLYLVDYEGGCCNIDFIEGDMKRIEKILIDGSHAIDQPGYCKAIQECIQKAPSANYVDIF